MLWPWVDGVCSVFGRLSTQVLREAYRNMVRFIHKLQMSWWRDQMETFSALLAICAGNSPVAGEFPTQRPVKRSFDVSFDLRLNKTVE